MAAKRRVVLWTTAYADLLTGARPGGIGVQMMFWSKVFVDNGWRVYSLYNQKEPDKCENCSFLKEKETHLSSFYIYILFAIKLLISIKPDLVICRGGRNRNLFFIALCCKLFRVRLVQFFGSDADMKQDTTGLSRNVTLNIKLFRLGLALTNYFVVQNENQKKQLLSQFKNKQLIVIPNIWGEGGRNNVADVKKVILWVGNTRKLKRPQWVFKVAEEFPDESFVIIGGNSDDSVYNQCVDLANRAANVDFLGGLSFNETTYWFSKAKVLLCTSEYEGFPNTFLQAWSIGVPVLSTVDPSDIIKTYNLGRICISPAEFIKQLGEILDEMVYMEIKDSIGKYFKNAHALQSNYDKLIRFLNI